MEMIERETRGQLGSPTGGITNNLYYSEAKGAESEVGFLKVTLSSQLSQTRSQHAKTFS